MAGETGPEVIDQLRAVRDQLEQFRGASLEGMSFGDREILATLGIVPVEVALGPEYSIGPDGRLCHEVSEEYFAAMLALTNPDAPASEQ